MTCTRIQKLIPLAVSRDLEPGLIRAVEEHAKACLTCFRELRAYSEQLELRARLRPAALEQTPAEIGSCIVDDVMAAVRRGEPGPAAPIGASWAPSLSRVFRYGAAVAAGFALFAVLRFSFTGADAPMGSGGPGPIVNTSPSGPSDLVMPIGNGPFQLQPGQTFRTQRMPPMRLIQYRKDDF